MLGLFYCFLSSGIFIKEIRYLYIVSIKNNILLRFQIILFPKTNLRRKQMAKSDLLKEAIADAKAVKETALANAKIALEEAFAPRIQSMLSTPNLISHKMVIYNQILNFWFLIIKTVRHN